MENTAPICPRCKKNPRIKVKKANATRKFLTYCRECKKLIDRIQKIAPKKTHDRGKSSVQICPSCGARKIRKDAKLCDECTRRKSVQQINAWCKTIYKMEELSEYVFENCEFPPELTSSLQERVDSVTSDLRYILNEIKEIA